MSTITIDMHHFLAPGKKGRDQFTHIETGEFEDVNAFEEFLRLTATRDGAPDFIVQLIGPNRITVTHHRRVQINGMAQINPCPRNNIVNLYVYTFTCSDKGLGRCCTQTIFRLMRAQTSKILQIQPEYGMSIDIREILYGIEK